MRILSKVLAAAAVCLLTLTIAVSCFILSAAGIVFWLLSLLTAIGGVALLFTHQTAGGIAFLAIAFLVSPYGLPAFLAWLVGRLEGLRCSLKEMMLG